MIPDTLKPLVNAITGKKEPNKKIKERKKKLTYYYNDHKKAPK